jgi:hypothetical protein
MTEITAENVTKASERWDARYRVRRDDGSEVSVEVSCTRTAAATAESGEAREILMDYGKGAALRYAESAQSPLVRGDVTVRLCIDSFGGVMHEYVYPPRSMSDDAIESARRLGWHLSVSELPDVPEDRRYAAYADRMTGQTAVSRCVALGGSRDEAAQRGLARLEAHERDGEPLPDIA